MGAQTFTHVSHGKDAKEAFKNAVEEAEYDYGHAGYTGTIAEKHDFKMLTPKGTTEAEIIDEAEDWDSYDKWGVDDKWGPAGCFPIGDGKFIFFGWASS